MKNGINAIIEGLHMGSKKAVDESVTKLKDMEPGPDKGKLINDLVKKYNNKSVEYKKDSYTSYKLVFHYSVFWSIEFYCEVYGHSNFIESYKSTDEMLKANHVPKELVTKAKKEFKELLDLL